MDKSAYVLRLFGRIAPQYDFMNRLLSFGQDRAWRSRAAAKAVEAGNRILDVGTGTGDMAFAVAACLGEKGRIVGVDYCPAMLKLARQKARKAEAGARCEFICADALQLPFAEASFDAVTMAFSLRNVSNFRRSLQEVYRVLRPGGKAVILDLGRPSVRYLPFSLLYYLYFFAIVPLLGAINKGNIPAYFYLPRSLLLYPPPKSLADLLEGVGFRQVRYESLSGGVVCIHTAIR